MVPIKKIERRCATVVKRTEQFSWGTETCKQELVLLLR
jgi:hypothetical protein